MSDNLNIRMYTWLEGASGLSWAYVMARLGQAFDEIGHNTHPISTNGLSGSDPYFNETKMLRSTLDLQKFGPGKRCIDVDLTYTVPRNFPKRFLSNSKHKCVVYNFEAQYWPAEWKRFYNLVDYYFPSSNFSAEVFVLNEVPERKIFVIPHGIDTKVFNSKIPKIKLKTEKKYKFVSVVAPHHRKNIPALLESYCMAFNKRDDVCLVLKTKNFKRIDGIHHPQKNPKGRKGFEILLGDVFKDIIKKYGKNIPEIELISGHVESVSSIYNACDCHVTATTSEGFFMPGLESMASNLINIATGYSGHLDYMNENNSLLVNYKMRKAKNVEQYWGTDSRNTVAEVDKNHMAEMMLKAYKDRNELLKKFKPEMKKTVEYYSWKRAAKMIIDATEGNLEPYKPGIYNKW